jgi:hypothetical protein
VPRPRTGRAPRAGRGYAARRDTEGRPRHGRVRGPRGVATAAPAELRVMRARARRGKETWPGRGSRVGRGEERRTAGSRAGGAGVEQGTPSRAEGPGRGRRGRGCGGRAMAALGGEGSRGGRTRQGRAPGGRGCTGTPSRTPRWPRHGRDVRRAKRHGWDARRAGAARAGEGDEGAR